MAINQIVSGIANGSAVCTLLDGSTVVASKGGLLTRYDVWGAVLDTAVVGAPVRGLAVHPDGVGLLATVARRGLYEVHFGGSPAATLLAGVLGAGGVTVDVIAGAAMVTSTRSPAHVVRVPLAAVGSSPEIVASNIADPVAVAMRPGAGEAYVLSRTAPAQLLHLDLRSGAVTSLLVDLGRSRGLAWTDLAGSQLALADADGRVLLVDVDDPGATPVTLADGLEPVWGVDLASGGGALVAGVGDRLLRVDLPPAPAVRLGPPAEPMYLSSWARVDVATNGVAFDDLVFRVDPPVGGLVSHSRDATFGKRPSVVLASGGVPGSFKMIAHDRNTGDELAVAPFDVTDAWSGTDGPPASYIGEVLADAPDPAWGGGDPYVPQNLAVTPVLGNRQVAVVIAETTDVTGLSTTQAMGLRGRWTDEIFDGVNRAGVLESVRNYWRDVSGNKMDLVNAGVVGPIRLPKNWASYGTADATTGQTNGWEAFSRAVIADLRTQNEALAAAGQPPLVDLMTVDSIVLVLRSVPATTASPGIAATPGSFVWPSATIPGGYQLSFEVARPTVSVQYPWGSFDITVPVMRTIQVFAMPSDWATREAREIGETAAHELGHHFGLPDEYAKSSHPQWARDRDLARTTNVGDSWSIMSWEEEFSQPVLVEKMMLGWVEAGHVFSLSFATAGPVDEEVVLHASDLGVPPAGRHSAAEIRIADGSNYYFEYRREQPTTFKDQDVPADRTVVGTDCRSGIAPPDRRNILRLRDDSDADRGEFQLNDDYEEQDTSAAAYPNDFKMTVLETAADFARIRIQYGDAKPDPQIRPWAPSTNWKSPDLRVTNARNLADNAFSDIPWEGHDNRIVATVRNPGQVDATAVRVNFFVKDFTLGGGAESPLGSDTHSVGSGDEVEFTSSVAWVPPPLSTILPFLNIRPHYCVIARIAEYKDPGNPAIREITLDNNEAQSNYTQLISVTASPSSREMGVVKVTNPLSSAADCRVIVRQTSPLFRTYVDKAWVHLSPGEERDVLFMTESMLGDPTLEPWVHSEEHTGRVHGMASDRLIDMTPNSLRLTGIADDHDSCHGFVTGGAHVLVRAAWATEFVDFGLGEVVGMAHFPSGDLRGRVERVDSGDGVDGTVLVTVTPPNAPAREEVRQAQISNGDFQVQLGDVERGSVVQAHYLGDFQLAPCDSRELEIETG